MTFFTVPLSDPAFVRALEASILIGIVTAVVGAFMVFRGLAFMGDALSHATFPGVAVAYLLAIPFYLGAVVAALGTALAIGWISRRGRLRSDTTIGVLFSGMFAFGVFLLSTIRNDTGDLVELLVGDDLGIQAGDLLVLGLLGALVLATIAVLWKELLYSTFDPLAAAAAGLPVARLEDLFLALIAVTIVISLQAVGIILVVAMLVTPAATAQLLAERFTRLVLVAALIGGIAPVIGLFLSYQLTSANGAVVVLMETIGFLLALGLGPKTGLLRRRREVAART
jgi:ABC-type Mn2+/Zn2+ transport system permease subunit